MQHRHCRWPGLAENRWPTRGRKFTGPVRWSGKPGLRSNSSSVFCPFDPAGRHRLFHVSKGGEAVSAKWSPKKKRRREARRGCTVVV